MVASTEFANFLRDELAPLGYVTTRRMFGKTGVFCEEVMFGMVTENILYLRVDSQNRATFKDRDRQSSCPDLAQMRSADCIEQCPSSGAKRTTYARTEFFSV